MLSDENTPTHLERYFYDVIWWKRSSDNIIEIQL
jgi:hypothetical protein